jgi:hypothetical protein
MGFAGYITVCVQLYCVSCHCLSLHVSAYMAIFRCVEYFYFHMFQKPITVAARSQARTVFARSNTEIVGSNTTEAWMFVCVRVFSVST